jgi:hypothetical protein
MEVLVIASIASLSYLIILCKIFGLGFVVRTQVLWDLLFTFGIPMLCIGTYKGMATAFLSGIIFSVVLSFIGLLTPKPREHQL